jgi:two-component SAPR family response regulator
VGTEKRAELNGCRVLIVEDEFLIATELEAILRAFGCVVVGPVPSVDEALSALDAVEIDGALLDANLRGRPVTPVAEELARRSIPFVLVTGYDGDLPEQILEEAPRVPKPFTSAKLGDVMVEHFARGRRRTGEGLAGG